MSYRLTDVADLPRTPNAMLTLVHPQSAVDIVGDILSPYSTTKAPIENLDPKGSRAILLEQLASGEQVLLDASGGSPGIFRNRQANADHVLTNLPPRLSQALDEHWKGKNHGRAALYSPATDSLAPALQPIYEPLPIPAQPPLTTGLREVELIYRWPDGTGVAGAHIGHGLQGLWDSAAGFLAQTTAIASLSPIGQFGRAAQSAWNTNRNTSNDAWIADFKRRFKDSNKQALVEVLGFDPSAITREQLAEAYEITSLLLSDPETRDMLTDFALDFIQAQDSTELSYLSGALVFELVLGILLVAITGGAGVFASSPGHLAKLAPLDEALKNLAHRLKISIETRYKYSAETGGTCEALCRPRPEGPDLQPRTLKSRRLGATTIAEVIEALAVARRRIILSGGYTPKYTQTELAQLVRQGLENDLYVVRLVESSHIDGKGNPAGSMKGNLGQKAANGDVRFWSTTADQIEYADTDPRLLCELLGVAYKPDASYKLAIIDRKKAYKIADAETIIPTFKNLTNFINTKFRNKFGSPELVAQVMTPEYQAKYSKLVEGMGDIEWESLDHRDAYLGLSGLDSKEIMKFETRFNIQDETGANQHFLGSGLTKHTASSTEDKIVNGALEIFTLEKNPQTFHIITNGGQGGPDAYVELVDLLPITFGDAK